MMLPVYSVPKPRSCQNCAAAKVRCESDYLSTRCKRCNEKNMECLLREPVSRKRRKETIGEAFSEGQTGGDSGTLLNVFQVSSTTAAHLSEVQRGMEYYGRSLCQWFPFVILSRFRQPAFEFAREKPFLSLVVAMLGCTQDRRRQLELAVYSRTWLSTHVIQNGEKSLEILQGLLLATHWYTFQWDLVKQRNLFIHLAMSLVVDLGLIKPPHIQPRLMTREEAAGDHGLENVLEHSLEEKRALLGCLYLSSTIATTSLNIEAPAYFNTYAQKCYLEFREGETLSDQRISHLCRLQHIMEEFLAERVKLGPQIELQYSSAPKSEDGWSFVKCWDESLRSKWMSIPDHTKSSILLQQYTYTRVHLHSCSLEPSLFRTSKRRLKALYACISSLRSFQAALLPLYEQPHTILDVPLHCFARANHSMSITMQLYSLSYGDIDAASIENKLQLMKMSANVAEKLRELVEGTPQCEMPSYHLRLGPMTKAIQQGIKARLDGGVRDEGRTARRDDDVEGVGLEDGSGEVAGDGLVDFGFLQQYLDTDDDLWLQRLLGEEEERVNE